MDIDSNCPYLLFGETTSHLTSKLSVTDGRTDGWIDGGDSIFLYAENIIIREIRKGGGGGRCNISRPGPSAPREIKI